jgi:dihydroorotase
VLLRRGRVVDPVLGIDAVRDVRLGSVVVEIGERLEPRSDEAVFDAHGAIVAPGFIDMHVHLREPGDPEKETLATGGCAALRGGFTAVACMPNTRPTLDDPRVLGMLAADLAALEAPMPRVYPIAAITRQRAGEHLCDYPRLARSGAVAFSDDGTSVRDTSVLEEAARSALRVRGPFISHCEPEESIVRRDVEIARQTGKSWHIAHVSTRAAVESVKRARANGTNVSMEVTPHHLLCTRESARALGRAASVHPPLRGEGDVRALRDAVRDGVIDVFASDHAPHARDEKFGADPPPGFTGLEIAVGAYAAAVPDLSIGRFVEMLSCTPARILGIAGGTLSPGSAADVTVFRDEPWLVDASTFASKGKVTPLDGMVLPRRVIATIVAGNLRYDARSASAA